MPFDAAQVELWFHNFYQVSSRCDAWDSRFGQNYWFDVVQRGPSQPVIYRAGASPRLDMVNAFELAVTKTKHFFPGTGPGSFAGSELQTVLTLKAWVRNVAYVKFVWWIFTRSTLPTRSSLREHFRCNTLAWQAATVIFLSTTIKSTTVPAVVRAWARGRGRMRAKFS